MTVQKSKTTLQQNYCSPHVLCTSSRTRLVLQARRFCTFVQGLQCTLQLVGIKVEVLCDAPFATISNRFFCSQIWYILHVFKPIPHALLMYCVRHTKCIKGDFLHSLFQCKVFISLLNCLFLHTSSIDLLIHSGYMLLCWNPETLLPLIV
jgi:hypothetical protein